MEESVAGRARNGRVKTRHGEYGIDAPYVPVFMLLGAAPLAFFGVQRAFYGDVIGALSMLGSALFMGASVLTFWFTTRTGKFQVWSELLTPLRGDERVLDVGCGRGTVLLLAAERLQTGRAIGVDIWDTNDQSGNGEDALWRNADAEGVRDRVEVKTGDMRTLPFEDASFDWVVSSLAVHNLKKPEDRAQSVREMARVLKPGGFLLLADFRHIARYAKTAEQAGLKNVSERSLGWRFWYGGPWVATKLVTARK